MISFTCIITALGTIILNLSLQYFPLIHFMYIPVSKSNSANAVYHFTFFFNCFWLCPLESFIFYNAKSLCKHRNKIKSYFLYEGHLSDSWIIHWSTVQIVLTSVSESTLAILSRIQLLGIVKDMNGWGRKSVLGEFIICDFWEDNI